MTCETCIGTGVLVPGSTNLIRLKYLKDEETGEYVETAVVTFRVLDSEGEVIDDGEGSLTFTEDDDIDGLYLGILEPTAALVDKSEYTTEITAVFGLTTRVFTSTALADKYAQASC